MQTEIEVLLENEALDRTLLHRLLILMEKQIYAPAYSGTGLVPSIDVLKHEKVRSVHRLSRGVV